MVGRAAGISWLHLSELPSPREVLCGPEPARPLLLPVLALMGAGLLGKGPCCPAGGALVPAQEAAQIWSSSAAAGTRGHRSGP